MTFKNPVIRGFYPDPSVCRARNKYYLVTSSFQYFPGVPLFESDDLINWKQIGHCLTRKSQLPLENTESSCGIFAPTIRHHNNRFYMTTTNVSGGGNFYVFTDDIYGEWSEPVYVGQEGIDPSLYFEDNRAYFMSNGDGIIQSEIDIETGRLLSKPKTLWHGTGGRYLESPHLYKIAEEPGTGGFYYLMAAEGGTEYGHMVTYARSENLWGPFEPYVKNPVLTNRNLGGYPIQGVGHADLIDDKHGNRWLFHLGFRQIHKWQTFHHLGREVFLMPADFDGDGWFTVGNGTTTEEVTTDRIPETIIQCFKNIYTFENVKPHDWRFLRNPNEENFIAAKDSMKIKSSPDTLDDAGSPAFIGLHQKEFEMELSVKVNTLDGEAGITLYMDENHHYDLAYDGSSVKLKLNIGDIKHIKTQLPGSSEVTLKIIADAVSYEFFCSEASLGTAQTRYLSSEVAGGFTGVVIGLYSQYGTKGAFNEFREFKLEYRQ
ncbi:MAG: glycoside hydrolase family 43 protein [Oscillospiraceae bacterium]|nr:glycoside hydrolase family 43 protein [Oscillospiraceae bacterium]